MSDEPKPIYAPAVIDFITVAAEYCVFMEKLETVSRKTLLDRLTKVLPLVYVKVALLPALETEGSDELPEMVNEEDYNFVRQSVWGILRGDDGYLEVFSPDMQFSETPIAASISEDLADIYQDLKNFVSVFADDNETNMNNAIVKVKENFVSYWGQKLVNVLRPLHDLCYGHAHDEEDEHGLPLDSESEQ